MIIPTSVRELIASGPLAHLTTINLDGSPQVTVVWVGIEDDEFVCAHMGVWKKVQNMQREMLEETGLQVQVDALLLDEPGAPGWIYQRWKTYGCSILAGEARPGSEPEAEYANAYSFTEVGWFDLQHPATWNEQLEADSYITAWLQRIQAVLGYTII